VATVGTIKRIIRGFGDFSASLVFGFGLQHGFAPK
jgi:hypothetical protein